MSKTAILLAGIDEPCPAPVRRQAARSAMSSRARAGALGLALLAGASFAGPTLAADGLPDFSSLVEEQGQSVVSISITRQAQERADTPEGIPGLERLPEELRRFFEQEPEGNSPEQRAQPGRGIGSGFIISEDGYIVTNAHVVDGASNVIVTLQDREEFVAELVGQDDATDLALLKIDASNLPAVQMGNSDDVKVGQWVLAIGSPFGLDNTATQGIVSAVARTLPSGSYTPFIQTDVAVNPGNSGGPLFNTDGIVVGVNSQIYSRSGGYQGLSFAIPANVTTRVVEQLKTQGYASRGWLGVAIQDVNQSLANAFGLDTPYGALVSQVSNDGPAKASGIQTGDIITGFNGQRVNRSGDLPNLVGKTETGLTVPVEIVRNKEKQIVEVVVGEFDRGEEVASNSAPALSTDRFGLVVGSLADEKREALGVDSGVEVENVVAGSAAERAGILAQDVIVSVGGVTLKSVKDFDEQMEDVDEATTLPVLVQRGQSSRFLALEVPGPQG